VSHALFCRRVPFLASSRRQQDELFERRADVDLALGLFGHRLTEEAEQRARVVLGLLLEKAHQAFGAARRIGRLDQRLFDIAGEFVGRAFLAARAGNAIAFARPRQIFAAPTRP